MPSTCHQRVTVLSVLHEFKWFVTLLVFSSSLPFAASSIAAPYRWQVPSSVRIGQPFDATISAIDTNFDTTELHLTGIEKRTGAQIVISELSIQVRNIEFTNVGEEPLDLTGWRVYLYDSRSNSVARGTFQFPIGSVCPANGVFQLQVRPSAPAGPGSYPVFTMISPPALWPNMAAAVLLVSSDGRPIDVLQAGINSLLQPGAGSVNLWSGDLLPQRILHTRTGAMNHFSAVDWRGDSPSLGNLNANMLLPFIGTNETFSLQPSSVTLTNGTWSGDLILNQESLGTNIFFRADDLAGNPSDSGAVQVLPRFALSLVVPDSVREGSVTLTGKVSVPEIFARGLSVQLSSSDSAEVTVPSTVEIPAGSQETSFTVNSHLDGVLDGTAAVIITAESFGFNAATGTISHEDLQSTTLHLEIPAEVVEGGDSLTAILRADDVPAPDVVVALLPSIADRLEIPASVLLKAGSNSVSFPISAKNDLLLNDDAQILLRAEVAHWSAGIGSLWVRDNETATLSLQAGLPVEEGSFGSGYLLVLGGSLSSNLTVSLSAEPAGSLNIPATIIIPAGSNSVSIEISAPENALVDGTRTVTLHANTSAFTAASCPVQILDNEIHQLAIESIPLSIDAGTPMSVRIRAVDDLGRVLSNRNDNLILTADTASVSVLSNAPPALTNGQWAGVISLSGADSLVTIEVEANDVSSRTLPFILKRNSVRTVSLGDFSSSIQSPEMVHVSATGELFLLSLNGLISVEPQSATLRTYPGAPGGRHLLVTDNGQFLYWASAQDQPAQVTRFDLDSGLWTNFSLAAHVAALQVVPGAPHRYVAATPIFTPPSTWNYGAFMFEDGTLLPEGAGFGPWGQSYTALVFDGAETLFGYEGHITSYGFARHSVTSNGITFLDVPSATDGLGTNDLQIADGLVYGQTGVFDPLTSTWVHRFPFEGRPWLHSPSQQVILMEPTFPPQLRSFDLQLKAEGSALLPPTVDTRADLAFWSTNGIAVLNRSNLFLVEVPFLSPNARPDLALQFDDALEPAAINAGHPLKLIVSNAGSAPADDVFVRYTVPVGAQLANSPLPMNASFVANTITFHLSEVNANSSVSLDIAVVPLTGFNLLHSAEVAAASLEINLSNNQATEVTAVNSETLITEWAVGASDIIWDKQRGRLYATVNDVAHDSYGWIVSLNVASQSISRLAYAGTKPGRMTLSDDDQFLYVVTADGFTVRRLRLDSLVFDSEFDLLSYAGAVKEISAVPSRSGSVAVNFASSTPGAIYDEGIQRPGVALPSGFLRPGGAPDVLIGTANSIPAATSRIFAPPAVAPETVYSSIMPDSDFVVRSGVLISGSGLLFDSVTLRLLGIIPEMTAAFPDGTWKARPNQRVSADLANGLIYFLEQTENGATGSAYPTIHAFTLSDLSLVGSFTLPNVSILPRRFLACNQTAFAFLKADGQILTCANPFTNSATAANISVSQLPPVGPTSLGDAVSFQVAVTNLGPNVATNVVLRNTLPAETSFLNASSSDGFVRVQGGLLEISWESLGPGEGRVVTIRANLITARELKNVAFAFAENPDPDLENNRSYATPSMVLSRVVNLQPSDVVFDATANRLLLSAGNTGDHWSNSIVSVDTITGLREQVLRTEFEPTVLAISDDGRYLYAGTAGTNLVLRIDLNSRTNDLRIQLKTATITQSPALSMVTVPGQPESIIVSSPEAAVAYDGIIPRPQVVSPSHQVARGETADIFYQAAAVFRRLRLTQAGLSVELEASYPAGAAGSVTPHEGVLAIASGHVMSGVTGEPLGQANLRTIVSGQQSIQGPGLFDPAKGSVMFLGSPRQAFFFPGALLAGYSTNGYQEQWTAFIPDVSMFPSKFIHAGPGRAAIIATCSRPGFTCPGSQLVLLNLDAIPSQASADLKLMVTSRTNLIIGSHLTVQSTIVNTGPWSLTGAVLQVQIPPGLEFLQGTTSAGSIVTSNEMVLVEVGNLKSSEGAIVDLTFLTKTEGDHALHAEVSHQGQDLVIDNNETNILVSADSLPSVSIADAIMAEGTQSSPPRLLLSRAIPEPVQVQLAVRNGTATANSDFTLQQITPIIPAGATSAVVQVTIREDQLVEGPEAFVIELLSATNATLGRNEGTVTILDNDTYLVSVVSEGAVTEGNIGSTNAMFKVSLSPPAPEPVRVSYATGSGTAGPADYDQKSGVLLFPAGVTNLTLNVTVFGDTQYEPDETFAFVLQDSTGARLANGGANGLIRNDDTDVPLMIREIQANAQTVTIQFDAIPGETYLLHWRADLDSGNWVAVGDAIVTPAGNGTAAHSLTNLPAGSRTGFYRIFND